MYREIDVTDTFWEPPVFWLSQMAHKRNNGKKWVDRGFILAWFL